MHTALSYFNIFFIRDNQIRNEPCQNKNRNDIPKLKIR